MSFETELKLLLPESQVDALKKHSFWQKYGGESASFHLANLYFDTPDLQLNQARVALRVRQKQGQYFQTLKTKGESVNGLTRRGEWEWPIAGPDLDIAGLKKVWPNNLAELDTSTLKPLFSTDFDRTTWEIEWQHPKARVEAALDVGIVKAGQKTSPICELELELIEGDEQALAMIARELSESISLAASDKSKAERGLALLDAFAKAAVVR